MTILEPNQPWPQYYFRRRNFDGIGFNEGYEDKTIHQLIYESIVQFVMKTTAKPIQIIIGPRAKEKMEKEESNYLALNPLGNFAYGRRMYMGMDVIFSPTDGLWIM